MSLKICSVWLLRRTIGRKLRWLHWWHLRYWGRQLRRRWSLLWWLQLRWSSRTLTGWGRHWTFRVRVTQGCVVITGTFTTSLLPEEILGWELDGLTDTNTEWLLHSFYWNKSIFCLCSLKYHEASTIQQLFTNNVPTWFVKAIETGRETTSHSSHKLNPGKERRKHISLFISYIC